MRWLTNFYDFRFKWTTTTGIGIHPTKTWLSQLVNFKKAICTWGHFRRTLCNKILFNLGKNATETYGMLQTAFGASCMNRAIVFEWHKRFKEDRESVRDDVGGVRKSDHQSWLARGLGLGLLCWGFKGVQEEIPWEEASTLEIGSVAFRAGQCTSPQLHPCHWLFDQDGHQDTKKSLETYLMILVRSDTYFLCMFLRFVCTFFTHCFMEYKQFSNWSINLSLRLFYQYNHFRQNGTWEWWQCRNTSRFRDLHNWNRRCLWCNGYRRRKWTRRHEFKS